MIQENISASLWPEHRKLNDLLAGSLRKMGQNPAALRVQECHRVFDGWKCRNGHRWARPVRSCQHKLCPFDARARSARLVNQWAPVLAKLEAPRYLVLSEKNCGRGQLHGGIRSLFYAFERLRHRKIWHQVRGCVVCLEVTYNRKQQTWHPHLNIVFDGPDIDQGELVGAWIQCTRGRGRSVWIQRANPGTVREIFKYISKLVDFVDDPEAVAAFMLGTKHVRFLRSYGSLRGACAEDNPHSTACPDCGSEDTLCIGGLVPGQAYVDGAGIIRFRGRAGPEPLHFRG